MKIKVKENRKTVKVDVSCRECATYKCLVIQKTVIDGVDNYYCIVRDKHGCPDNREKMTIKRRLDK